MTKREQEWLTLTWENHNTYYRIHLEEDLFGQWWLTKIKTIDNNKEEIKKEACESYQDGIKRIGHIKYHYEKLGFSLT
ncbi:hypothetical protein BGC07_10670 [Piscirickettsia litoralis]|uniref:WGR domain-containing protein n=2 Tax=Piscirickettsia litoralis TaxID=1891921 RepID=A0ABX3A345_9GAMM|nr:hypothetical protein BGC07_10670 [Piscirickettsia litoralis]